MPRRTNSFQRLITLIERQLAPADATVTESALVPETLTGNLREVDILIKVQLGVRKVSVGIECRDHHRKADIHWIEQARSKFDVLPIDRRVVVSKRGFTKPAGLRAKQWNIETISLDEAISVDWAARLMAPRDWSMIRMRFRITHVRWASVVPQGVAGKRPTGLRFIHQGIDESADDFGRRLIGQEDIQKQILSALGQHHDWVKATIRFTFAPGDCYTPDNLGVLWVVNWIDFDFICKAVREPYQLSFSTYNQAVVGTYEGTVDEAKFTVAMSQTQESIPRGTYTFTVYDQTFTYDLPDSFITRDTQTDDQATPHDE